MHVVIAEKLLELLKSEFPTASLALAGSVASGKYTKDSDIDIVFVNDDFKNSHLLNFSFNEIKIGLFILTRDCIKQSNSTLQSHHIDEAVLVSKAKIYYDPDNKIKYINSKINELYEKRELVSGMLISELKKKLSILFSNEPISSLEKKMCYLEIIEGLQLIFFLKKAYRITTKKEGLNPFSVIKEIDKYMYDELLNCIPFRGKSIEDLQKFYSSYFINHY